MLSGAIGGLLGLLGVGLSLFFSYKLNKENQNFQEEIKIKDREFQERMKEKDREYNLWLKKYNSLVQLISFRFNLGSPEFMSAMNGIPVVYYDSKPVINSVKAFYNYVSFNNKDSNITNEKLINLFVEMHKELGIEEEIDETFLYKIFES